MKRPGVYPSGFEHWGVEGLISDQSGLWYALGWVGYGGQLKKETEKNKEKTYMELWTELIMSMWGMKK